MRHDASHTVADAVPSETRRGPRIVYRTARVRDAADQAEVFHHAVMQGAAGHYTLAEREAWAMVLPRDASAWSARQALFTTLVADCEGRCVASSSWMRPRDGSRPSMSGRRWAGAASARPC